MTPGDATRVVVIGVGNPYRRDDGVGPAVVSALREYPQRGAVELVESDGEPSQLLTHWAGASCAIVVDAVRTSAPQPGRVHRRSLHGPCISEPGRSESGRSESGRSEPGRSEPGRSEPGRSESGRSGAGPDHAASASSHAVEFGQAVALAQVLDQLPATLLLYAVEVADTSFGEGLSPQVELAARRLAAEIADDWLAVQEVDACASRIRSG